MALLRLRFVGAVGVMNYVESSFSQWVLSRSYELRGELILTVGAQ